MAFSTDDCIVAIATPPGRGGIGVVRLSGAGSLDLAAGILECRSPLRPRYATYTRVRRVAGDSSVAIDEVVATYFPAPHSYTGEHVVEISAHGNPVVLRAIVESTIAVGARLAEPGEFTLRAFLNGKRDLVQAEAVADLIAAATPLQARVAFDQLDGTLTQRIAAMDAALFDLIARLEASLDFPEEGFHFVAPEEIAGRIECVVQKLDALLAGARAGQLIREGATVVIAGRPNVGKSSLFNILVGVERAIVTEIPGTTRDLVSEQVDIDGLAITLVDTAGWRETNDLVEREGVRRAAQAGSIADLLVVVVDASAPFSPEDEELLAATADRRRIVVANKCDLVSGGAAAGADRLPAETPPTLLVSARNGDGICDLRRGIARELTGAEALRDCASISNVRHTALLEQARTRLAAAQSAARGGETPEEFLLADLQAARGYLDEIVGVRTTDDLLKHIFERFCIGK